MHWDRRLDFVLVGIFSEALFIYVFFFLPLFWHLHCMVEFE